MSSSAPTETPRPSSSSSSRQNSGGGASGPPSQSTASTAAKPAAAASSSSHPQQSSGVLHPYLPHEQRLEKTWRMLMSCVIQGCFHKSEKAVKEGGATARRELDEAVLTFIKTRMEWNRLISRVESKIQGREQELEALDNYVRTQPRLGKRKRRDAGTVPTAKQTPEDGGSAIVASATATTSNQADTSTPTQTR